MSSAVDFHGVVALVFSQFEIHYASEQMHEEFIHEITFVVAAVFQFVIDCSLLIQHPMHCIIIPYCCSWYMHSHIHC